MFKFALCLAVAACLSAPAAARLGSLDASQHILLLNNSHVAEPNTTQLYNLDTSTGQATGILQGSLLTGEYQYASGGKVCGSNYFYVLTEFPVTKGIGIINLKTGAQAGPFTTDYLWHVFDCTSDPNTIIGVASHLGKPATFELRSFSVATQNVTTIGTIPMSDEHQWMGYDTIFSFTPDGSELWAAFAKGGLNPVDPTSGQITVMDTSSGSIKGSYSLGFNTGFPYMIFAPEGGLDAALAGSSFAGTTAFNSDNDGIILHSNIFTINGDKVDTKRVADVSKWGWTVGQPCAQCSNGVAYCPNNDNTGTGDDDDWAPQMYFAVKMSDFSQVFSKQIGLPHLMAGAFACA